MSRPAGGQTDGHVSDEAKDALETNRKRAANPGQPAVRGDVRRAVEELREGGTKYAKPDAVAEIAGCGTKVAGRSMALLDEADEIEAWGGGAYGGKTYDIDP